MYHVFTKKSIHLRGTPAFYPERIPAELREWAQWISWLLETQSKAPHSPHTDQRANAHDPVNWGTYGAALRSRERAGLSGIGFVLTASDPYAVIDLDNCYEGDALAPWAQLIVEAANSFTERSQSGRGLHIIVRASFVGAYKHGGVEVYGSGQYIALTGDVVHDAPIRDAGALVELLTANRGASAGVAVDTIAYSRLSLAPGGPLRRADGSLRRLPRGHWLNQVVTGNLAAYDRMAAKSHWDRTPSGARFHGIASLVVFGYPDEEIATIARALLPEERDRPEHWWIGEIVRCLYKDEIGARSRYPHARVTPTRYQGGAPITLQTPVQRAPRGLGRPKVMDSTYLLRWYGEELGKRSLVGPRSRDAAALGISVSTLDRLDRELVERGAIVIVKLPGNRGRQVTLATGALWDLPVVPSKVETCSQGQVQRIRKRQRGRRVPVCIEGVAQGGYPGGYGAATEEPGGSRQRSAPACERRPLAHPVTRAPDLRAWMRCEQVLDTT